MEKFDVAMSGQEIQNELNVAQKHKKSVHRGLLLIKTTLPVINFRGSRTQIQF